MTGSVCADPLPVAPLGKMSIPPFAIRMQVHHTRIHLPHDGEMGMVQFGCPGNYGEGAVAKVRSGSRHIA